MSKPAGKTLVPELRFPEFRGSGEWVLLPIGEKIDLLSGYAFQGSSMSENSSGIKLLRGINLTEGVIRHNQTIDRYYLGSMDNLEKFRVKENDLVIAMDGSKVGKNVALITPSDTDALLVQRVARLRSDCTTSIQFIFQLINSLRFQTYVDRVNTSSGIPHISANQINGFQIYFPTPAEQQKIADCLFSIDELITAHTQKHDALKAHKKGLMQQLFPAEDETIPKLRFPEFRDAGEWEEMKLGEVTGFSSGGTPSKDAPEYWDGEIPWISAASMHSTCINNSDKNITKLAIQDGARTVPKGTLLLLVRGSMLHKRIPVGITENEVSFNQDVKALILRINIVERFLLYLLVAAEWRLLSSVTKTGIGAGKLDTADLRDFLIWFPADKKEQQKIANFLSSLDELITAQAQKITSLKTHKKGLMQQLFPATDEVGA